eukprot:363533-Chlamydomonas_euryale.AAC.1
MQRQEVSPGFDDVATRGLPRVRRCSDKRSPPGPADDPPAPPLFPRCHPPRFPPGLPLGSMTAPITCLWQSLTSAVTDTTDAQTFSAASAVPLLG